MVKSSQTLFIEEDNWGQEILEKILIKNEVNDQAEVFRLFQRISTYITQNYPYLNHEFKRVLQETLELALSGILIDNSIMVSPLGWFANQQESQELLEYCNQLMSKLFEIQVEGLTGNSQQTSGVMIEF